MGNTKISELASITTLSGSEIIPLVQSGVNKKVSISQISTLSVLGQDCICLACSDETTSLAAGTAKVTFRMPFAMTLNTGNAGVRCNVNTAPEDSTLIVDVKQTGTTILSTLLSIDASTLTSVTATSQVVVSNVNLTIDSVITIDITQVGSSTPGKGLKVYLIGTRL